MEEMKQANAAETPDTAEETAAKASGAEAAEDKKGKMKKEIKALQAELETAQKERDDAKRELAEQTDRYMRLAAEYDNYRKRTAKEREGIYTEAVADAVGEVLAIFDNLERAAACEDAEKLREGLEMIFKTTESVLSRLGVEKFGEKGDVFDPNMYNAVMHSEDGELPENTVAEVFQHGYRKDAKVIRCAMVKVAN